MHAVALVRAVPGLGTNTFRQRLIRHIIAPRIRSDAG
jgi:hypothetical protein